MITRIRIFIGDEPISYLSVSADIGDSPEYDKLPGLLRELADMLEAPEVEDTEIF